MNNPKLTLSIATRDRANYLEKTITSSLNSIIKHDLPIEIDVIIDGLDQMETIDRIKKFESQWLRIFEIPHGGISKARNFGASVANAPFIRFQDDDDTVDIDLLINTLSHHHKNERMTLVNSTRVRDTANQFMIWSVSNHGFLFNNSILRNGRIPDWQKIWGGRFSTYTQLVIENPFDENLIFGAEDIVWANQIAQKGLLQYKHLRHGVSTMERSLTLVDVISRSLKQGYANGYIQDKYQNSEIVAWAESASDEFAGETIDSLNEFAMNIIRHPFCRNLSSNYTTILFTKIPNMKTGLIYAEWSRLVSLFKSIGFLKYYNGESINQLSSYANKILLPVNKFNLD